MNKIISVQQIKKNMDLFDENDNYCDSIESSISLDPLKSYRDINTSVNNKIRRKNKKNKIHKNKLSVSSSNLSASFSQTSDDFSCTNKKCLETNNEIQNLKEDCSDMEKKISMLVKSKAEEFIEISDKLTKVCKNTDELKLNLDIYLNQEIEDLQKYDYKTLAEAELNLMKLLIKVKNKISNIEYGILNGNEIPKKNNSMKCFKCGENEINILTYPCEHLILCEQCVRVSAKCPLCYKFIEYYDKVFLPDV